MWSEILRHYDAAHGCNKRDEIAWFRRQPSLRRAIEAAARATDRCGRRYSHQRRTARESIAHATVALAAAEPVIARAKSFHELLTVITTQLRDVRGIGPLYRYDTAFRICAHRGLFPTRVYLHAGTRQGARALGLPYQKEALELDEIPAALRNRPPYEIEDILCIYKTRFSRKGTPNGCGSERERRQRC